MRNARFIYWIYIPVWTYIVIVKEIKQAPEGEIMNEIKAESSTQVKTSPSWKSRKSIKTIAMYLTMVCVSTIAIYWLEHASMFNAFRTALVAAVGKTFAANWVSGIFE